MLGIQPEYKRLTSRCIHMSQKRILDWIGVLVVCCYPTNHSKFSSLIQQQSFILLMCLPCGWGQVGMAHLSSTWCQLGTSTGAGDFQMAHSHAQQGAGCWFGAQHVYGTGALAPITQLSPWPSWASTQQGSWVPRASISREQSESTWHFCKLDRSRIWSLLAYSVV